MTESTQSSGTIPSGRYKTCHCCKRVLPESSFSRNAASKDGLQYYCKACKLESYKKIRAKKIAAITPSQGEFAALSDRELQDRAAKLLNELRARGWQVTCEIAYLQKKKI